MCRIMILSEYKSVVNLVFYWQYYNRDIQHKLLNEQIDKSGTFHLIFWKRGYKCTLASSRKRHNVTNIFHLCKSFTIQLVEVVYKSYKLTLIHKKCQFLQNKSIDQILMKENKPFKNYSWWHIRTFKEAKMLVHWQSYVLFVDSKAVSVL